MEFVFIPEGEFLMGSSFSQVEACIAYWGSRLVDPSYREEDFRSWILKEVPQHSEYARAFDIGRFPVTNEEYERFARATRHPLPKSLCRSEPPDHPVWGVSYDDAQSFAGWFGGEIGRSCRLPTEGEWEYAARGRLPREYPFGELFDPACCNTIHSGIGRTTPVHRYANGVSEFGVYDLAGNVEEWTADYYAPYTGGTFVHDDLSRQLGKRYRVLRGGSFARGGDLARCARRHGPLPAPEFCYIGFRLVATSSEGR